MVQCEVSQRRAAELAGGFSILPTSAQGQTQGCSQPSILALGPSKKVCLSSLKLLVRAFRVRYPPIQASTKNVTWHCDVGCSVSGKASANWSKERRTNPLTGSRFQLLTLLTRRAGCHESGSSSSREALASNPFPSLEGAIREFYPIAVVWLKWGDGEKPSSKALAGCERF